MLSVAKRVMYAIDLVGRNEFELALEQAAICVDISSQRKYKKLSSSKSDFKKFLEEYYWVMEYGI